MPTRLRDLLQAGAAEARPRRTASSPRRRSRRVAPGRPHSRGPRPRRDAIASAGATVRVQAEPHWRAPERPRCRAHASPVSHARCPRSSSGTSTTGSYSDCSCSPSHAAARRTASSCGAMSAVTSPASADVPQLLCATTRAAFVAQGEAVVRRMGRARRLAGQRREELDVPGNRRVVLGELDECERAAGAEDARLRRPRLSFARSCRSSSASSTSSVEAKCRRSPGCEIPVRDCELAQRDPGEPGFDRPARWPRRGWLHVRATPLA